MDSRPQTREGESDTRSPTDTRQPSVEGLAESFQSTNTIRRRPEPPYAAMTSPNMANYFEEGTSTAHDRSHSRTAQASPMLGPDRGRPRPRKPAMPRRASSNAQAPHRGEVFSVDDGISEVEEDAAERQQSWASTIRRRTHGAPTLTKVHSTIDTIPDEDLEESVHDLAEVPEELPDASLQDAPLESEAVDTADDDDDDISDAESFTLKDRQQAINETHPFGIRIWKPALYKKDRSVQKNAEGDIHSSPGGHVSKWLLFFNLTWTLAFGWWLSLIACLGALTCYLFAAAPSAREYGRVLWGLASYLFYPFGKFVRLEQQDPYIDEDEGEGRSITEYEQWQSGDLEYGRLFFGPERNRSIIGRSRRSIDSEPEETTSLLGRGRRDYSDPDLPTHKRRLFGRGEWNVGRVIFFLFFYLLITPTLFVVSGICWFLVFWIPMGRVTMLLLDHLRRHPLALSFESDIATARAPQTPHSSILLCTYRAVGSKYWKYTIDGTNIFLINLMAVVVFVIFDWLVLEQALHLDIFITSSAFLFVAGLFSIIPLAYFIGQAVASISAQSSMGVGAAINAFFSTIVEVYLYCVALQQGKGQLVEGSIVGSIFAGILFLPGLSMCFGAIKRKTQRFNSKSAGVTSTMLLFAVIGAFGPTLFYQIYGTHELNCLDCVTPRHGAIRDCKRCYFSQTPALNDRFYLEAVRPYCYMAAGMLFLSYIIGLWFTLRTHAAVIWSEVDEKRHEDQPAPDIRDSHFYKRILNQSLRQAGVDQTRPSSNNATPHVVPPKTVHIPGLTEAENNTLVHQVAEIAATAATVAARDARMPRHVSAQGVGSSNSTPAAARPTPIRTGTFITQDDTDKHHGDGGHGDGGHDAPNWSRIKSAVILMGATVLYAIIAEILVDTVDVVLEGFAIDEKFLGITLFALVPNTTEFLNAISFAMNGNIALSMEIGSAYALQVCLLQIPALVLFSALYTQGGNDLAHTFTLLFPQWDMVTVILCVFLLSYMYGEGKSNYFKGSILLLSYLVVVTGFYFSGYGAVLDEGNSRFDTLNEGEWMSHGFKTVGRGASGAAF
ncbi:Sodium/calcium exchanger protein-domain-containing protein [Coniochaeta sp. 2T2.1]|nr:Sodium/calcium exchanger protein-domain-containing protein [Coniochaeta sp. 2T2.1]